jgi:PAS domain S-box-containing protein
MATKILLVEDNPGDARLIKEMLAGGGEAFELKWVSRLADGLEKLSLKEFDLVLLDLGLPDSSGIDTFMRAYSHAPQIPFVVLSGLADESLAITAVRRGAQDYLLKDETDSNVLRRAIYYATERKKVEEDLRRAREELEERVIERTAELVQANAQLQQEIEQRRQTEAELAQSRESYRAIFENTGTATVIVDVDSKLCMANAEFEKLSGYKQQELAGKSIEEFVVEADLQKIREYRQLRQVHPGYAPRAYEFRFKNRQGKVSEILMTASVIPGTDQTVGSLLDITDRKNSEMALKLARDNLELKVAMRTAELARANADLVKEIEERRSAEEGWEREHQRLFALLEQVPVFVYLKAPDYSVRFANRAFRDLFGNADGKKCYQVIYDRSSPCQQCRSFRVLLTGEPQSYEWDVPGSDRTFQIHNYPFKDLDSTALVMTLGVDLTERRRAEEARCASEEKYRLLVNTIPAVIFQGYADGSIEFFDNKIEDLTGYSKEEFEAQGLKWTDLILDEDLEGARQAFVEGIKSDQTYVREYRIRHKDGRIIWVQGRGRIFLNHEGKVEHIQGVLFNVSVRKQAEEELLKREANLAKAQRIGQMGNWEWEIGRDRVSWSDEIFHIFKVPKSSRGISSSEFLALVHADDQVWVQANLDEAQSTPEKPLSMDFRGVCGDGTVRHFHSQAETIFDQQGKPVLIRGTIQDVTERRRVEEELRKSAARLAKAQRLAQMGHWEWDLTSGAMQWSGEIYRIFGLEPGKVVPSCELAMNLVHPEDRERVSQALAAAMAGGSPFSVINRIVRAGDGAIRVVHSEAEVAFDGEGKAVRVTGIAHDITAQKLAEERLQESQKSLRYLASQLMHAQERERKRLARELHDELGQSLLVLKLRLKALERKIAKGPEVVRTECKETVGSLDQIVDNVRRLSRDLSPGILEDLGLSTALQRLIEEFSKHHDITEDIEEVDLIDDLFPVDAQLNIYRIFQESLTNIGKYADASQLTIKISREDDHVFFMIADNGCGFKPAEVLASDIIGRGLGLTAMEERVRMLGGGLEIWSQPGAGTKISFKVPISKQEQGYAALPARQ